MADLKLQRETLTTFFKTLTPNVYFQPPASVRLNYPAIIFNRDGWDPTFANDSVYLESRAYEILVISDDPDATIAQSILNGLNYVYIDREYVADNLYHVLITHNYN